MLSIDDIFKSRGYNVPTYVLDADGKQVKIETREDEEQQLKYTSIVKALISAGYYRAILKQISPFDVIVGGMTWCIDSNDIDIDVDLLFKDSLTIGQKISLTEKIVVVLPKIKCPHFIEPHQIQGLDFIHIHPVIEWLIQWSDENRKKKQDYLLSYALNQYYKRFTHPQGDRLRELKLKALKNIHYISDKYHPRRICKQSDRSISDLLAKVEGTLSEYGLSSHQDSKYIIGMKGATKFSQKQIDALMDGLTREKYAEEKLNFENVEHLYEDIQLQGSEKKLKRLEAMIRELKQEKDRLEKSIEEAVEESSNLNAQVEEKSVELDNLAEEDKKIVKEMQDLIHEHEKLKEEEKKFKEFCKSESNDLESEIQELENHIGDEETEELRTQLDHLRVKLDKERQELGRKTRNVSGKERIVDQIPSRAELSQYQKRFLELYKQVALKHTETKRYFILFNTVNDKFSYMEKEFKLLNSIQENYAQVMTSGGNKDEFLQKLKIIVAGIQETRNKVIHKRNENKKIREKLTNHLINLQDQKRDYIYAVKELSEEYKKHEQLSAKLQRLREAEDGKQ